MVNSESLLVIHWLWLGLVLIGLTLFFTAYYFRRQSRRLSKALSELYTLNQTVKQDALDFLEQSWPILKPLGCLQIKADIQWFGENKQLYLGGKLLKKGTVQVFHIERDDMVFDLKVRLNRKAAEPGSLSFLVIKTYLNMLEQNLVLKQAEILTSQKRLERYQLFVQHEIKNIAQFIQLLSEQVNTIQADKDKIRLMNRLHQTLPVMAERARKTIVHMNHTYAQGYECRKLSLRTLLQEVVGMYHLEANVEGEATLCLPTVLLTEVFKNILGNFMDHGITKQVIDISIKTKAEAPSVLVKISCLQDSLSDELQPERLFEPFWTTSESGMGLGLFLARELLKKMNGQIFFEQQEERFAFLVQLPVKSSC